MGIINNILVKILKFYKKFISSGLRSGCIFTPTCSEYAMETLQKHNLFASFFLIIWRILRCNSLNKGGFDPVPDNPKLKIWLL